MGKVRFLMFVAGLFVAITGWAQDNFVPTPEFALSWAMGKDQRKWEPQYQQGNRTGIIFELVPKGDTIKNWKEMVTQKISFTTVTLPDYVENWKNGLLKSDTNLVLEVVDSTTEYAIIKYNSPGSLEIGIWKFIAATDGIYCLGYVCRPDNLNADVFALWSKIVSESKAIPNPRKKKNS